MATAKTLKAGDAVRITDRAAGALDLKSGLFFNHYRGLAGTVQKVFADGQATVSVDLEALPEEVWRRHMNVRDQMRERWLAGLPDDARRKLTPEQRQFDLRYVVLVDARDLERRRPQRNAAR